MKYMLLIHTPEAPQGPDGPSEDEQRAITAEYMALRDDPAVIDGAHLQPTETATTVRVQDGAVLTTDGPFAELKEALGGYYTVEADDLDTAIAVAARVPAARLGGAIEIRPVVER